MNKHLIIWCFLIHSVLSLEKFLQFIRNENVKARESVYELNQRPLHVDAFDDNQILIKYIQHVSDLPFSSLNFYCHVKKLDSGFKINNAHFCKKQTLSSIEDCHNIVEDTQSVKFEDPMEFKIKYDPTFGITAILSLDINIIKNRNKPFNGFYYCKLNNFLGFISSNYIEIQDYEFYKKKFTDMKTPKTVSSIEATPLSDYNTNSFPIYLDCGKSNGNEEQNLPSWADKDLLSSFSWNTCTSAQDASDCFINVMNSQSTPSKPIKEIFDYYQYPNGTAVLLSIKGSTGVSVGFMCKSKNAQPIAYAMYLKKLDQGFRTPFFNLTERYNKIIQRISPKNVNIFIREGTYKSAKFRLYATYVANPDHSKVSADWKRNDYSLPSGFVTERYQLTFPQLITKTHSGIYILKVSQSDPYDSLIFNYSVTVLGVPKLKNPNTFSPIIYYMVDETVNISVSFESNIIKKRIDVNGFIMDSSTPENKKQKLNDLGHKFPFLSGIDIDVNFDNNQDPGMIVYQAKNLYINDITPQPKTHIVTFLAENSVGISKASVLIRVFENPVFTYYLNNYNCTNNCKRNSQHEFKCSIETSVYVAEGCSIEYLWSLNELNLNNMKEGYLIKQYFNLNNDTLIMKPIKSDDGKRDDNMVKLLSNATLRCQINIFKPLIPGQGAPIRLYTSANIPHLRSLLEAVIKLEDTNVDAASTSWILALIISLIVIVIIVVLTLYFCLRGSGETYNVDQKERAQGHDPEKEIRDNEVFQPYERDHETNVIQPSHLSFNDDDSVGVGSDDGELDVYDIDPGKFNEEGSFIGQYASDPRRRKANNV